MTTREVEERIHVRYEGQTYDFLIRDLDIADNPTDADVLSVAQRALSERTGNTVNLSGYVTERYLQDADGRPAFFDVHPQAKFGV